MTTAPDYAALPRRPIELAFKVGNFPMCDYKIPFAAELRNDLTARFFLRKSLCCPASEL